jgi:4'-phosphopantetheinyl transferase
MDFTTFKGYVRCSFDPDKTSDNEDVLSSLEVFYGLTEDFSPELFNLPVHINKDDQLRAERQHNATDKKTILICYTMLRQILARKLGITPGEVTYTVAEKGKPGIAGDALYFNISHTRDAFALAVSESSPVGIDLEKVNRNFSFVPIVKRFFSEEEAGFILNHEVESRDLFFMLWTRKEALLKAFGTGILPHISHIEVFRPVNIIVRQQDDDLADVALSNHHYIYSRKLNDYYLSVAVNQKAEIVLTTLNDKMAHTFFQ